ncbi:hypothetical protein ASD83_12815 [Devosia sp. Root685]|nr:hypothetical protein ASD83_12815 [Devosia sp. Root685]
MCFRGIILNVKEKPLRTRRVLLLVGAGASIGYGAPSTWQLTDDIGHRLKAREWMKSSGAVEAYRQIAETLSRYLKHPKGANFEQIYHVAHELSAMETPGDNAVDQYRPLLAPFLKRTAGLDAEACRILCDGIVDAIYGKLSECCEIAPSRLAPLGGFLRGLRENYVTRVYTTNYDDFILQSAPDLFTGFPASRASGPKMVDPARIWGRGDDDCVFHLHGSVHLGFAPTVNWDADLGDLYWYDERDEARRNAGFHGSDVSRMDGTGYMRTAVITGLDKLSRLQRSPMSHYYASFARDVMSADLLVMVGYGMGDLHLNSWISAARRKGGAPPIVLIDKWDQPFLRASAHEWGRRETAMLHEFRINARGYAGGTKFGTGWTLATDGESAIWDRGFDAFLDSPEEFGEALRKIGFLNTSETQ